MNPTIYLHHDTILSGGNHLPSVNAQHRDEGYPKSFSGMWCFYQYFIERDGAMVQCRLEMDEEVAYKDAHKNSISICLAGNMDKQEINPQQLITLKKLLKTLQTKYGINALNIKEHRNYQNTSCPGSKIPRDFFAYMFLNEQLTGIRKILMSIMLKLRALTQ